jgi:hypothetical protein
MNVQRGKTVLELKNTCSQQREHLTEINIDMENRSPELQVHIQKLIGELETLCKVPNKVFQTTYMDNRWKGFDE